MVFVKFMNFGNHGTWYLQSQYSTFTIVSKKDKTLSSLSVFWLFSPAFSKLEQWLENLKMHLDIGLPLVSEVDQLYKAFWEHHNVARPENGLHTHPEQPEQD